MEPKFALSCTFTHDQHRKCVDLVIRHTPLERAERIGLICIYVFALPLALWLKEPRILSRLLVALPLLIYNLFFKAGFRVMFHKERYENSTLCYSFHAHSICVSFSNPCEEDVPLTYADVFKIIETDDQIHLLNSKDVLIALPKDGFSDADLDAFRAFLTSKTAKEIEIMP